MSQNTQYSSKWFGNIAYNSADGTDIALTSFTLNDRETRCHLMIFEDLSDHQMQAVIGLLNRLEQFDAIARQAFDTQCQEHNSLVFSFIKEHFEDYGEDIEADIAQKIGNQSHDFQKFLDHLELGGTSVSEDAREEVGIMITLDYSLIWLEEGDFNSSFTDQLLVARFDQQGEFLGLAHES